MLNKIVFSALTILTVGSSAVADPITPKAVQQAKAERANLHGVVNKWLGNVDINISPNIDVSILDQIDAGFRYSYEVHPAFQSSIYTRVDRWTPHVAVHIPGIWTRVEPGAELVFLRQFATAKLALESKPHFDPSQIPLSAQNALNMSLGEVVMLPVHLDLLAGPEGSWYNGPLELYGRTQFVLRGLYQIQAMRLADDRVRLRLIATRQRGLEVEGDARLRLEMFPAHILNKAFQGIFDQKVASYEFDKGVKSLVMADYIFDLSNPQAREAYDNLLSSKKLLTNGKLVNPINDAEKLQKIFVADLEGVDQIAKADTQLPINQRRITQIFKGHSHGKDERSVFELNLFRLLTFRRSTDLAQSNHIVFLGSDNEERDFFAPTQEFEKQLKVLFGLRNEQTTRKAQIITPSGPTGEPTTMGNYAVSLELKDRHMGVSETAKALERLRVNIAEPVIQALKIEPILQATSYRNARVFAQVIFNERSWTHIEGLPASVIAEKFAAHLGLASHQGGIAKIAQALSQALDSRLPAPERIRRFMDLQRSPFVRSVGTGCLMSLFPQDHLDQFLSVYLRVDATAFKAPLEAQFGTAEFNGVVKASEYIENLLNNGTFDLRLETFGTTQAFDGQVVSLKALAGH